MKVRIVEQHPGELAAKAEDVVRVVERLSGLELLKADTFKQTPGSQVEYKALLGAQKRSRSEVQRIKALMDAKIAVVLGA